ncbi:MAG: hypothetical protein JAY95_01790, partial [Candidatus Thiodiazotropha taylori]|nr:hypothetical protein [Candidatus Thiodiazotropha taylori]
MLVGIHTGFRSKANQIESQLDNQKARQEIGLSIYQRLFSAKASVFKLSTLDNRLELEIVKKRFDDNLMIIKEGLAILHNGGVFKDQIATNIPGQNSMNLVANYYLPESEGYVLEVLELGPAIHNLDEQAQLLYQLIKSRIELFPNEPADLQVRILNLIKTINTILQRTQENAARILYDSQENISHLSVEYKESESLYDSFRLPVVVIALGLSAYLLLVTLTRVGKVIENRKQAE